MKNISIRNEDILSGIMKFVRRELLNYVDDLTQNGFTITFPVGW